MLPSVRVPGLHTHRFANWVNWTRYKAFCQFQSSVTPTLGLQWLNKSVHQDSATILDTQSQEENAQKIHKPDSPPVLADRPLLPRNGPPRERYLAESCQAICGWGVVGVLMGFLAPSPAIINSQMQPGLKSLANGFLSAALVFRIPNTHHQVTSLKNTGTT